MFFTSHTITAVSPGLYLLYNLQLWNYGPNVSKCFKMTLMFRMNLTVIFNDCSMSTFKP